MPTTLTDEETRLVMLVLECYKSGYFHSEKPADRAIKALEDARIRR